MYVYVQHICQAGEQSKSIHFSLLNIWAFEGITNKLDYCLSDHLVLTRISYH